MPAVLALEATDIMVAAIAATPPTLVALATFRRTGVTNSTVEATGNAVERIDKAVNHQPEEAPTLVEKVDAHTEKLDQTDKKLNLVLDSVKRLVTRMDRIERKVG